MNRSDSHSANDLQWDGAPTAPLVPDGCSRSPSDPSLVEGREYKYSLSDQPSAVRESTLAPRRMHWVMLPGASPEPEVRDAASAAVLADNVPPGELPNTGRDSDQVDPGPPVPDDPAQRRQKLLSQWEEAWLNVTGVLESIREGFFAVDRDWQLTYINHHAEETWRQPRAALLGRNFWQVLPAYVGTAFYPRLHESLLNSKAVQFELPCPLSGAWLHVHAHPERGGLSVYFQDMTARREAESQAAATNEQLREVSRRLVQTQELERREIARELHDEVGQLLTGIRLSLAQVSTNNSESARRIEEAAAVIGSLQQKVQSLTLDLRPALLDELGLLPALTSLTFRIKQQTGLEVTLRHFGLDRLQASSDVIVAAYRIVQESLTNVARHAGVDRAAVHLWADERLLSVQIEDTGCGFNAEEVESAGRSSGLGSMRDRCSLLGGSLIIDSSPGRGTHISADLPVSQSLSLPRTSDSDDQSSAAAHDPGSDGKSMR